MTQESRTPACPPEFQWNSTLNKCVDCVPGYYGLQCSKSCVAPFYGVGCQKLCSRCPISLCDVSYGCPRITGKTFLIAIHVHDALLNWIRKKLKYKNSNITPVLVLIINY